MFDNKNSPNNPLMYFEEEVGDTSEDPLYITPQLPDNSVEVTLEGLLTSQMKIAGHLQALIQANSSLMSPKEFKELASTAATLVGSAHRAGESLRTLATYRTFVEVVIEFIRRRADTTGTDLVRDLLDLAREMRCEADLKKLL